MKNKKEGREHSTQWHPYPPKASLCLCCGCLCSRPQVMARAACSHLHLVPSLVHPLKSTLFRNQTLLVRPSYLYGIQRRFSSSSSKISMSLRAGIVGLPNVGKSTLFNAVVSHSLPFPVCVFFALKWEETDKIKILFLTSEYSLKWCLCSLGLIILCFYLCI